MKPKRITTIARHQVKVLSDIDMMRKPDSWPRWPWLPLKHQTRAANGPEPTCACMCEEEIEIRPVIYEGMNLYSFGHAMSKGGDVKARAIQAMLEGRKEYESFEALAREWRID